MIKPINCVGVGGLIENELSKYTSKKYFGSLIDCQEKIIRPLYVAPYRKKSIFIDKRDNYADISAAHFGKELRQRFPDRDFSKKISFLIRLFLLGLFWIFRDFFGFFDKISLLLRQFLLDLG